MPITRTHNTWTQVKVIQIERDNFEKVKIFKRLRSTRIIADDGVTLHDIKERITWGISSIKKSKDLSRNSKGNKNYNPASSVISA